MLGMATPMNRMTVPDFVAMKAAGQRISMLTAYDFPLAALLDRAGVDAILVGDSLGMVVQGRETTLPVTLDQIIYHAEMVGRAVQRALLVADMPFLTFQLGVVPAIEHAGRILKETRCQAVKLEGGVEQAKVIEGLVSAGIPVMAHVGLRPQSVNQLGGYRVQRDERRLLDDARAAEEAGAFSIRLGVYPSDDRRADHADCQHPHHRDRCRRRLRWPGPGDPRLVGTWEADTCRGLCGNMPI